MKGHHQLNPGIENYTAAAELVPRMLATDHNAVLRSEYVLHVLRRLYGTPLRAERCVRQKGEAERYFVTLRKCMQTSGPAGALPPAPIRIAPHSNGGV